MPHRPAVPRGPLPLLLPVLTQLVASRASAIWGLRFGVSLAAAVPLGAQAVTGRVLDGETDSTVAGATVTLLDLGGRALRQAVSSADGEFHLALPAPGRYRVRAQAIGYAPTTSPSLDLTDGDAFAIDFHLKPVAVPLAAVEVTGPAPDPRLERWQYYERKRAYEGFARFLEGEAVRPTALTVSDLLRDVPGIKVSGAGGKQVVVEGRSRPMGRRGCTYYLDGAKFPVPNLDGMVSPSDIVAIEVYAGLVAPLEYGGKGCVIAVWTGITGGR